MYLRGSSPCSGLNWPSSRPKRACEVRFWAFFGRGLLEGFKAQKMLRYKHSGFSVDTSVCTAAQDSAGLERLLRCCARPPFSKERLRKAGRELIFRCAKQHSEQREQREQRDRHNAKRGVGADELHLTPMALIARLAAPCRAGAATACAPRPVLRRAGVQFTAADFGGGTGFRPKLRHGHGTARAWRCINPARGLPLWDGCDAPMGDGVEVEPDWEEAAQLAPDFEVDQRVSWSGAATAVWPTLRGRAASGPVQKCSN